MEELTFTGFGNGDAGVGGACAADGFFRIAAATPKIRVGDVEANAAAVFAEVRRAAEAGVGALALPELTLTGYTCADLFFDRTLLRSCERALERLPGVPGGPLYRGVLVAARHYADGDHLGPHHLEQHSVPRLRVRDGVGGRHARHDGAADLDGQPAGARDVADRAVPGAHGGPPVAAGGGRQGVGEAGRLASSVSHHLSHLVSVDSVRHPALPSSTDWAVTSKVPSTPDVG